jgi:hypothetical protein
LRLQPSTIFLDSLLIGDLVVVVVVYPFAVVSGCSGQWMFGSGVIEKHRFCQFVGFFVVNAVLMVTGALSVVSFDGCLFIVGPLICRRFMGLPTALGVIIGLWITCAVLNSTPFYGFGEFAFDCAGGLCTAEVDCEPEYIAYMLVLFGAPVVIVVVTSVWTCCFAGSFVAGIDVVEQDHRLFAGQGRRICGIFGVLLLVCVICFFPVLFAAALAAVVRVPPVVFAIADVFLSLLFVANPVVQSFFGPDVGGIVTSVKNRLTKTSPSTCDVKGPDHAVQSTIKL